MRDLIETVKDNNLNYLERLIDEIQAPWDWVDDEDEEELRDEIYHTINAKDEKGWTALMWSVEKGNIKIFNALIRANAEPDESDKEDLTPLMRGVKNDNLIMVEALIKAGADKRLKDIYGNTALDYAQRMKNKDIVKILE